MTPRTPTLREPARDRRLPDHQMMDRETLGWIEMNSRGCDEVYRSRAHVR
jgi:hypothetical protein